MSTPDPRLPPGQPQTDAPADPTLGKGGGAGHAAVAVASGEPPAAATEAAAPDPAAPWSRMSYKYQRLREKLRQAITSGELAGKLPGERVLARRFHVNAKTLSKALTDLAAEGLLDRSIGRGTYVRGSAPGPAVSTRWLVLCDVEAGDAVDCLLEQLRQQNADLQVVTAASVAQMRPSFLAAFGAVIDLAENTPSHFLRDLVVRNLPVVAVNREPRTYSTHAVLVDLALGAQRVARDLLLCGHRRLAAVEPPGSNSLSHTLRQSATRYLSGGAAVVEALSPADVESGGTVSALVERGTSAVVCHSASAAAKVKAALARAGVAVPGALSLAAVGCLCRGEEACPCTGYFTDCVPVADAVATLLREGPPARPSTLWLAGRFVDRGTVGPTDGGWDDRPNWPWLGDAVA